MRKGLRVLGLAFGLTLAGAGSAAAQVAWDSPMLIVPQGQPGLGLYLMETFGGDIGFMGAWRPSSQGVGFRIGIADEPFDDIALFGGVDVNGRLARASREFPLDIDWVLGAGMSIGDDFVLSFPAGITLGRTLEADGVRFVPYATPRVVLDAFFGDRDDELDLDVAVDIGIELSFQRNFAVRFGGTLGRDAVAIGVVF